MTAAVLTSKGQITIPLDVRQSLKITQGDRVEFVEVSPGRFEILAKTRSIKELRGMFGPPMVHASIDEINEAIAAAAAGEP